MAVTLTIGELANHLRFSVTHAASDVPTEYVTILTDSLAAATELVEGRAPDAPEDSQNLAVARICAYWLQSPNSAPARFGYNAWQNSGAAQLLGAFITRRAEVV